ncbi:MAG TPA: phosphatase PAP2 family protein [Solirubrobacterales bacterium]|nr:phosphatase PAP2 family protein [Solirubrobacterales bacterium]
MRALINRIGNWLPHGYGDAGKQLGFFVLAELSYEAVRGLADGAREQAFVNGANVISLEKSLHTFFEPSLQSVFINHGWVIDFANYMYMNSHFVVTTTFLVWLYIFRNKNFYFVRNMFVVAMALAIVGYALVPTAPPRLFPQEGFVDTITDFAQVNHDSGLVKLFINPYAAIPSMHVAFSTMIGVTGVLVARHKLSKIIWAAYPVLVFWVVVVTANHFWIDGAAGLLVATLAMLAATSLARARPAVWSFRPATT